MNPLHFTPEAPGTLVPVSDSRGNAGFSFRPDMLPPKIDFTSKALRVALSDADRALARLEGTVQQIKSPEMLFRNYLRREALLSSKIEGVRSTLADLVLFEVAKNVKNVNAAKVADYLEAFEYGRSCCAERPLSRSFFQEMHALLMKYSNPFETRPGELRDCLVLIGERPIGNARFVPPEHAYVAELLDDLERYLIADDEPPLIKAAVAHYQFETIHPFRDGNGRIGRILISLWLQQSLVLTRPMLYLSSYFDQHKQRYYDSLLAVSVRGAWEEWLLFFLRGVTAQSNDASKRTTQLVELRDDYHQRLSSSRVSQGVHRLIDEFFVVPAMSIPHAAEILEVGYGPAKAHFVKLMEAEILDRQPLRIDKTNYYLAKEIIKTVNDRLFESPAQPAPSS